MHLEKDMEDKGRKRRSDAAHCVDAAPPRRRLNDEFEPPPAEQTEREQAEQDLRTRLRRARRARGAVLGAAARGSQDEVDLRQRENIARGPALPDAAPGRATQRRRLVNLSCRDLLQDASLQG